MESIESSRSVTALTTVDAAVDRSVTLKAVLILVLFFITFGASLLPFILRQCALTNDENPRRRLRYMLTFSFLSCYGGGIFVGTCLMDLLPDAKEKLTAGITNLGVKVAPDYPLTEFMVCAGFLLILISEQVGVWYKERKSKYKRLMNGRRKPTDSDSLSSAEKDVESNDEYHNTHHDQVSDDFTQSDDHSALIKFSKSDTHDVPHAVSGSAGQIKRQSSERFRRSESTPSGNREKDYHFHSTEGQLDGLVNRPYQTQTAPSCSRGRRKSEEVGAENKITKSDDKIEESPAVTTGLSHRAISASTTHPHSLPRSLSHVPADGHDGAELIHVHFDPEEHSTLRALLLVMALSLHSLFEGMALGLQSNATNVVALFVALVIHKCIVSFSLGLRLVQSPLSNSVIVVCDLVFCCMALVGGVIGILVTEELTKGLGELINGLLQGVACGTFLYITFFEILPHELNPPGFRMAKLFVLVLGFLTVSILMFFT